MRRVLIYGLGRLGLGRPSTFKLKFDAGVPLIAYFLAYSSFGYVTVYTALFIYLSTSAAAAPLCQRGAGKQ
jgi:hypothetical protein